MMVKTTTVLCKKYHPHLLPPSILIPAGELCACRELCFVIGGE